MAPMIDLASLTTKPRIGVTRTSPKGPNQVRPSTPLWVTHQPRGADDLCPWVLGDEEPISADLRYSSDRVIELTDVPRMTMTYDNIEDVIAFMGAPGEVEGCQVDRDDFGACVYTREWGEIWLGQGTTVWKLDTSRCYIQHRSSPTMMFVWPPVEVPL